MIKGLKHNFLSISQLCDKGNNVTFDSSIYRVIKSKSNETIFSFSRSGNTYIVNLNKNPSNGVCLLRNKDESWLWHRRISHIHMNYLNKFVKTDLVDRLSNLHFEKNKLCDACKKGKQIRASFKCKNIVYIDPP